MKINRDDTAAASLSLRRARLFTTLLRVESRPSGGARREWSILAERSLMWFVVTLSLFLAVVLPLCIGRLIYRSLVAAEPAREMGDLRLGENYRDHPATSWALVDEENLALATDGGGIQRCRLDSEILGFLPGFWRTYDSRSVGGMLAEDSYRQVYNDGKRLWFVGERGSLSSCDPQFHDWKLHYGGGGFIGDLDLAGELTAMVVSPDGQVFAAGTRRNGLGVYDVSMRQWSSIQAAQGALNHSHVTALLLRDDLLWAGTEQGLNVFRLRRENGVLKIAPEPGYGLPKKFSQQEVRALSWTGEASGGRVQCLIGRGAQLEATVRDGRWRVLVGERDHLLDTLTGAASFQSLTLAADGFWLVLPSHGFGFYDLATRRLRLRNEGLPVTRDKATPVTIKSARPGDPQAAVWAVARDREGAPGALYRRSQSWLLSAEELKDSVALITRLRAAHDSDPVSRYLLDQLSSQTRGLLGSSGQPLPQDQNFYSLLAGDLNEVLRSDDFYEHRRFAKIALTEELLQWIERRPQGEGLLRFNRLLLEEAYSGGTSKGIPPAAQWRQVSSEKENVVELQFVGQRPLARLSDGTVKIIPDPLQPEDTAAAFFAPAHAEPPYGPAEFVENQLFVGVHSGDTHTVARYLPALRGWQALNSDSATPIKQLRAGNDTLWVAKVNGEAGYFAPLSESATPAYKSVNGSSALPTQPGQTVTAANSQNLFWFVRREADGRHRAYTYDNQSRVIADVSKGINESFSPLQLRAAGPSLYLWGKEGERGAIYKRQDGWSRLDYAQADLTQMLTAGDEMFYRRSSGEVFLYSGSADPKSLLIGQGRQRWRKLAPDRFGRLWGISQEGELSFYHRPTGSWTQASPPGSGVNDVVVAAAGSASDRVYIGATAGLRVWESTSAYCQDITAKAREEAGGQSLFGSKPSSSEAELFTQTIRQFDFDGRYLWSLVEERNNSLLAVWRYEIGGGTPQRVWSASTHASAPAADHWTAAVWARFIDDELWWVTNRGWLWRYGLETRLWNGAVLSGFQASSDLKQLQMAESGLLWWLTGGGDLYASDPRGNQTVRFNGAPNYHYISNDVVSFCDLAAKILLGLTPLAPALLIVLLVAKLLRMLFKLIVTMAAGLLRTLFKKKTATWWPKDDTSKSVGLKFKPKWIILSVKVTLAFLVAAVSIYAIGQVVQRWWVDPYQPFVGKYFAGRVNDYAVNDDELTVKTADGNIWVFECDGAEVAPLRFVGKNGQDFSELKEKPNDQMDDDSGNWRLNKISAGFTLKRKNLHGDFLKCSFGPHGLEQDQLQGIAIVGETLVAATPVGMVEYGLQSDPQFLRFTPLETTAGRIARAEDKIYFWNPQGVSYRFTPESRQPWTPETAPWPRNRNEYGVRWRSSPAQDEFPPEDFDPNAGRFFSDQILRLAADTANQVWFQTMAGWRSCVVTGDERSGKSPSLNEPIQNPPNEASPVAEDQATPAWRYRRTATPDGADGIMFTFVPSGSQEVGDDPFGSRARWPDEDVRSILPDGDSVWLGTAYALRRRDNSGNETIHLPGKKILGIVRQGGRLFCRADDGDYRLEGRNWVGIAEAPQNTFTPVRSLSRSPGPGVVISAVERITGDQVVSELQGFSAQHRRFLHDTIQETAGADDGFWAVTPAGIQRLWLAGNRVSQHRSDLNNARITALRRGDGGALYALAEGQTVWRNVEKDGWRAVRPDREADPFAVPLRGSVSPVLQWARRFVPGGDQYELLTGNGPIEFIGGQLSIDLVVSTAGAGQKLWQSTPAGVVQIDQAGAIPVLQKLLPWPEGITSAELRVDEGRLVCGSSGAAYCHQAHGWSPARTNVFEPARAVFDGERWVTHPSAADQEMVFTNAVWLVRVRNADRPRLGFRLAQSTQNFSCERGVIRSSLGLAPAPGEDHELQTRLNALGQYPFDVVRWVINRSGQVWLAHGDRLAVYPAGVFQERPFVPTRYLQSQFCQQWLDRQWQPRLANDKDGYLWLWLTQPDTNAGFVGVYDNISSFLPASKRSSLNPFQLPMIWSGSVGGIPITATVENHPSLVRIWKGKAQPYEISFPSEPRMLGVIGTRQNLWIVSSRGLKAAIP